MDELEIQFRIGVIEEEIEFAKSQLQPHDTGHIHTAISWLKHRRDELKKELSLTVLILIEQRPQVVGLGSILTGQCAP